MDIFAQNHDSRVGSHTTGHDLGYDVDELAVFNLSFEGTEFFGTKFFQLAKVSSQTNIAEVWRRPKRRTDTNLSGVVAPFSLRELANCSLHSRGSLLAKICDSGRIDELALSHLIAHTIQRVARAPRVFFLLGSKGKWGSGIRSDVVVSFNLDQGRSAASSHVVERFEHGEIHRQRIHAINAPGRNSKSKAARRKTRLGSRFVHCGRRRISVVFNEEAQRQFPGSGKVHGFQNRPDICTTIPKVGYCHCVRTSLFARPGSTSSRRYAAADNRVGTQRAGFSPSQVHGAAAPAAKALCQA